MNIHRANTKREQSKICVVFVRFFFCYMKNEERKKKKIKNKKKNVNI